MRRMFLTLLCVAAAHCGAAASPTSPSTSEATLTSLVASGGYVLFFRHAARDTSAISNDALLAADRTGECVPGSELTSQGEADSVAIGEAFQRLRIHVDRVHASPTCRTQQMATLAFGLHETTAGLAWPEIWAPEEVAALQRVPSRSVVHTACARNRHRADLAQRRVDTDAHGIGYFTRAG
jgi:broad specificity phosphatase PhoE